MKAILTQGKWVLTVGATVTIANWALVRRPFLWRPPTPSKGWVRLGRRVTLNGTSA